MQTINMRFLLCFLTGIFSVADAACNETREAYAFTVYDQSSAVRALVTVQSLKDARNTKETVLVLNDHAVSPLVMEKLNSAFDAIERVTLPDWFAHSTWVLEASVRPEVMAALPKLYLWRLTQYKRLVYLDSRTLVLKTLDELFIQPGFAAVPEVGSDEDFDAGVMVLTPARGIFEQLLNATIDSGFTWSDENILNSVLSSWTALSPIYNTPDLPSNDTKDGYALTEFTKVIQFLGEPQPWFDVYREDADVLFGSQNDADFRLRWWRTFMRVKSNALEGKGEASEKSNSLDENSQDEDNSELARFRHTRQAPEALIRNRRVAQGCEIKCRKGSCSCTHSGSCRCKCNMWGRAKCRARKSWWG